jgi:hypothetical protein
MDAWIVAHVGENWLTIYLFLTLLKGIAILTPSVTDDKVVTMLSNMYDAVRKGKAPDEL